MDTMHDTYLRTFTALECLQSDMPMNFLAFVYSSVLCQIESEWNDGRSRRGDIGCIKAY